MTDTLLFLHLLAAASLFAAIVAFTALVLGARLELGTVRTFLTLWHIGLVGVFIFGIALAFDIDGYDIFDGWVLIAIGLWLAAGWSGEPYAVVHPGSRWMFKVWTAAGNAQVVDHLARRGLTVVLTAAPDAREGDWLDVPYDLPTAAARCGLSQYELLTTLGRRFAR